MVSKLSIFLLAFVVGVVHPHGYLVEPPGRASAWRFGFDTPIDYNDNECFCGGFNYQYEVNAGKCGICGDPWDEPAPREHEVGSIYATGTLVRSYTQGQSIKVIANVTTNHQGHFEYKICPNNNVNVEATQECLDLYPLYDVNHEDYFLYIGFARGPVEHQLQLPLDLLCDQCVVQWRYVAANSWGTCANGTGAVGCGPQEEFRGCADVAIRPNLLQMDLTKVEEHKKEGGIETVIEHNDETEEKETRIELETGAEEEGDSEESGEERDDYKKVDIVSVGGKVQKVAARLSKE